MKSKTRYFIVAPTDAGKELGDTLHVVCSTTSRRSFLDLYQAGDYEEEAGFTDVGSAKAHCVDNKLCQRPFVLS
jgi:hypothetical protein